MVQSTWRAEHGASSGRRERWRAGLRWAMAVAFFVVGIIHIAAPSTFMPIMPEWVPSPRTTIIITGICELAGAAGLLMPHTRRWAGAMLALYAVCVFPANIKHALEHVPIGGTQLGWAYHAPRLAFQPVIVWWALFAGGLVSWPFRRRSG